MLYLCRVKPLRHYLRGFLIAAWAGDKIAEFSFPEISLSVAPVVLFCKPRVCGEKGVYAMLYTGLWGSPPHVRGKILVPAIKRFAQRITPAYAGKRAAHSPAL